MASRLAIFHMDTGRSETVLIVPGIIEAPNWMPDDSALVVNAEGLIYRVPLDAPRLVPIDTDFARRCNNDHGISPDGRTLAISDSSRTEGSCIYTLPATGGTPRRVTALVPSYWHGWSPDGAWLTYTARREGIFDIFVIPVGGGEEVRLTSSFQHTDGPDYSPDGDWIWFNGLRDGSMDLWRIRPSGKDPERMTSGASVDWFPHPAPKGDGVLYLAYEPGTQGHPRDLPVKLRLLDPATGKSRTLYAMTGGQGTINTPCWAPDGRRFAFVETVG